MTNGLKDRVALVTGSGSGIGRATALALGRSGAHVAAHCRSNRKGVDEIVVELAGRGARVIAVQADLSAAEEVERVFGEIDDAFGRIDLLVNNAGDWMDKCPIVDCPDAQWEHMFAANARSVFLCCRQAARRMIAQGDGGAIVNLGSVAGHTGGGGGTVPYAAAKAAVHTMTRGLARELAPHAIRVNAVAPGMTDTPMLDGRVDAAAVEQLNKAILLGRMGRPEEIAGVILMLLSDDASYMTGEIVEVNGGLLTR